MSLIRMQSTLDRRSSSKARRSVNRRLRIESLEERTVPASDPSGAQTIITDKSQVDRGPPLLSAPEMPAFSKLDIAIVGAIQRSWELPVGTRTAEWAIQLPAGQSVEVLRSIGAVSFVEVPYWPNTFSVQFNSEQDIASFPARLLSVTNAEFYYPLVNVALAPMFVPNDTLFANQWHLNNTGQQNGTPGEDANLVDAWDILDAGGQPVRGNGVSIGIVDQGVQYTHPDLSPNYVAADSWDFLENDADPAPNLANDPHGTSVAGVAAGRGDNNLGVTGSAPEASFSSLRMLGGSITDAGIAAALGYHNDVIDIYNNSWGPSNSGSLGYLGPQIVAALQSGVTGVNAGRGGLGSVYLFAAGNGLQNDANVNYNPYANSRHVIAVGAIDNRSNQAWYSEPGAPMLVTAYSNGDSSGSEVGITTTDITGSNGYNNGSNGPADPNYTDDFGGTSSATPLVSGIVALMLDANPNLTYRDVQHILMRTARKNDPTDPDWTVNGAGYHINHKYGFGAVDAQAAVSLAKTWTTVDPELPPLTSGLITVNQPIQDNNPTGITSTFNITEDMRLEHVEVVFNATHTYRGDLQIVLTSPSGTRSYLATQHLTDSGANFTNWVFSSVRNWGENSVGTWTLQVSDLFAADVGTFQNWTLNLYGTPADTPPVLSSIESNQLDYVSGQGQLVVTNSLNVADVDSTNLKGATVNISGNYIAGEDFLRFTNQNGISGSFSNGTLTLTGTATVANYQAALRSVRYENTNLINPSTVTRTISFDATDTTDLTSNIESRDINIILFNLEPTLDPIANQPAGNEDVTQIINLTGISAGPGQNQDLFVTATSDNPSVIPDPVVNYFSPDSVGSLSITPVLNQYGSATITVKVKDSGGTTGGGDDEITRTFTVTVLSSNDPPSFSKGPDQFIYMNAGAQAVPSWATNMSAGPPDESGQSLTFVVSNDNNALFSVQPSVAADGTLTYTPATNAFGAAHVSVSLTDNGGTANGGSNVSAVQTLLINVEENDAPTISSALQRLSPIPRDKVNPAGDTVAFMVGGTITDPDPFSVEGVAVVGLTETANGTWEYSLDAGASWTPFGSVAPATARLLRAQDMVRFVPATSYVGSPEISYHAWDQTTDSAGNVVDLSTVGATGGRAAFSVDVGTARLRVAMVMTPIAEDAKINRGDRASSLIPFMTDSDANAKRGMAISTLPSTTLGTWEYSINGGITWKPVGSVSESNALLLRDRDRIRFVGYANRVGETSFDYHAWDQTTGAFGKYVDFSSPGSTGGSTAFSQQSDTIYAKILAVNDRPVLDKAWPPTVTTIAPTNTDPPGNMVASFMGSAITDSDAGDPYGIAVVGASNIGGKWQFRLNGTGSWTDFGLRTVKSALLLRSEDEVRFMPVLNGVFIESATFKFKAWDQTSGAAGGFADTRIVTAFSTVIQTAQAIIFAGTPPANTAPTLNAGFNPSTTPIVEDSSPPGDPVSKLLARATSDPDTDALKGIAVVAQTGTANGRWQYWLEGGRKWLDMPAVNASQALLLRDIDLVRFLPNKNFHSQVGQVGQVSFTFHAWDQTQGSSGQLADLTLPGTTGGASAFSIVSDVANFEVTAANDAPILDPTRTAMFTLQPAGLPDNPGPVGDFVSTIIGTAISDIDLASPKGIAITKLTLGNGEWQYRLTGPGNIPWRPIPAVSGADPFLLRSIDRIRFKADPTFVGTKSVSYRAWDQSAGTAGTSLSTAGQNCFSIAIGSSLLTIGAPNNRPVLNPKLVNPFTHVLTNATNPSGNTVASLLGNSVVDLDVGNAKGIALTSAITKLGTWEYSTDGGATWNPVNPVGSPVVSTTSALLLRSQDLLRLKPNPGVIGVARVSFYAWDQTSGAFGARVNVLAAGATAFSKAKATTSITINSAPELNV